MGYDITKMRRNGKVGRDTMCGRYYVDDETAREIEKLVKEIDDRARWSRLAGDVHPTEEAPVLIGKNDQVKLAWQRWGFSGFQGNGVIFNSRSETALRKSMFRESILHRRAVIPCTWFYEWSKAKEKAAFFREDSPVLFLAGFFNTFGAEERFVILTTEANRSVAPVHDRMPLILERDEIRDWILNDETFQSMIRQRPVVLKKRQEYEQQELKLF